MHRLGFIPSAANTFTIHLREAPQAMSSTPNVRSRRNVRGVAFAAVRGTGLTKTHARAAALTFALASAALASAQPVRADPAAPPCQSPIALALADRPGTGRTTTTGGSPCVATPGEVVIETGARRQVTTGPDGTTVLSSAPLTFVRVGVVNRLELGLSTPSTNSRATTGTTAVAARGEADIVIAAKYLLLDTGATQASFGASYAPPTGTGAFSAGAPTFSVAGNIGAALGPKLSITASEVFGTATGADANGLTRPYFVYAPSYTLAYAVEATTTVLVQVASVSRQGPVLPAGHRGFIALQHQFGARFAFDVEYERNLSPQLGNQSNAVGFGLVWIAARGRHR